jgi:zinc protease
MSEPVVRTNLASATPAPELPSLPCDVTLTTLESGLTIIVREDHSAPVVSAQAWCMAGSIHEGKWLGAGLSHVLEHMLFKGTTSRQGSRIDQEVQEAGGYMNAYTSFDRTVYHIDVPNTGARVAIDILCDIMQHASLPSEEMEKEKQVIVREMDMNVDDPMRRSSRRLFETAYTRSPYRFTVIGYPDIFHELKTQDIADYYHEKYAANNVFYVVTGDINAAEVVKQIRECYQGSKARALPPVVLPAEPRQAAPREVVEEAPIELGYMHLAWHIPELRHPDVPVLDVLASLLGNGRSSRLYQAVREGLGLVHGVDAWTYSPGLPGLFGVSATFDGDKLAAARQAILEEIERVKQGGIVEAELAKARKQFLSATLSARKTMQGQAQDLGANWLAAHDLNFSERYLAKVKAIQLADLARVAREYLTIENRTLYALVPMGAAPSQTRVSEVSKENAVRLQTLPNGLRLLTKESHRLPFVDFRLVFRGGVLSETPANSGATQLMGKLLLKGTKTRSGEEISRAIESVGGSLDSYGGNNSFGLNAEVMSEDLDLALELIGDVLLNPLFPEAVLTREREVQLASIRAQKDHLLQSAFKLMRRRMFGERGYGLDALGSEESVERLQVADLRAFHQAHATPDNCVMAVYGDFDAAKLHAAVERTFVGWKAASLSTPAAVPGVALNSVQRVSEARDKKQAVLVVGFPGTQVDSPDRYVLDILQETCSDLGSRLFMRIREKLGLAYYVGAQSLAGLIPGYFAFYAGTMPEKTAEVERELLAEAGLLRQDGITAEELSRAKAKILGQKKIGRQDLGSQAMSAALDELYGLGYANADREDARYEAVTLDQVREAARRYLRADAHVISIVSPG